MHAQALGDDLLHRHAGGETAVGILKHDLHVAAHRLAYLFISHDLRVVRALSHKVMVMRAGDVVEEGPAAEIFAAPKTDYTRALMAAALNMSAEDAPPVADTGPPESLPEPPKPFPPAPL